MKKTVITKTKPEKSLLVHIKTTAGRNNTGRITIRHRGGGSRKMYRQVSFGQTQLGEKGTVRGVEYDPNRNAYIMLVEYAVGKDGAKQYLIAPHTIKPGDEVICAEKAEVKIGNRMRLKHIPAGEVVFNIELQPGGGGKLVRSAGASARIDAHDGKYTQVVFPSSEIRKILSECFATIGTVSNPEYMYKNVKNAGHARLKGKRPHVRGSAMNPVDHPHGGGEGRSPIGMKYPKTPWGKPALGVKTRDKKKWTSSLIIQRRKKKKKK
jgi:large subunit ribosomal protein L2